MRGAVLAQPADDTGPIPIPGPRRASVPAVRQRTWTDRAPHLLALALFAAYTTLSVMRYRRMETRSWDLGIFEQAVRAYAHFQPPVADLKGPGANILGDHFSPVTALLAPAYRLFPTPVTLLVAQAALFALAAVPVTRAATRLLGRASGLCIGIAYGLSWGIQQAADFDFHEICFAVPLIAFSLEALLGRRWRAALLWAAPLVLVKEDLGITLTAIALAVAWRARHDPSRAPLYALGVAVLGAAATLLTLTAVIPAFNTTGGYDYWSKVDGGPSPFAGAETKLRTLAWLLLPTTGLLALRSPLLLAAAPTVGWRFLSGDDHYWSTDWHYSAVLMPVLFLALADAADISRRSPRPWLRTYADRLPACAAAAALALTTSLPLATLTEAATYRTPPRVVAAEELLDRIPDGATVEANVGPISRLTGRCRVMWVGDTRGVTPDWIALNNSSGWVRDPHTYARQLHPDARYRVAGEAGGYLLLERRTGQK
ncbi:DUF2079 domain-containing protein [Streptomyces sp. WAC05374]|uniref:DUF2079 domain-containing protein n=1 Tax=Streptomyces sp. WAC05374 TaxID=2487420 RepID=UPI000F8676B5|nr:DUF2079 domain-containing protein [Streptomyces sp. WAC05374]RST04706.1 DUF2079 domain-containing protein [Streptomyces sp. WAC05374]TDF47024.1 DUF2079 domain-containing protein [Streptomyces sp. WAC05374]TDF57280.1 DUF2079 domain-containing protein [Streptomyces sp. WAC05374]TDF61384.1 DUF2079 domain-containing protein [Streptomyces sp. WAC05374]